MNDVQALPSVYVTSVCTMRGMQLVRPGAFGKAHDAFSSFLRKTSCSHGWLRLVVQCTFATIIVVSFVLIIFMAIQKPIISRPSTPDVSSRCRVQNCRVSCTDTPFYGDYGSDIVNAITDVDPSCSRISLLLNAPTFVDGALPVRWLSAIRASIHELVINGGNLAHIPPNAFMCQCSGNINTLVFNNITITNLAADGFVGLSSLRQIYIKECNIPTIQPGAFKAVDDTLKILTVTGSGEWSPVKVAGTNHFSQIGTVDFSGNNFHDTTIGADSFTGISMCRILYLNSCRITAIESGAFDNLLNIKSLFLNNNFLTEISPDLFRSIAHLVEPRPRINLQDNLWYCDCENSEGIIELVSNDLLLIEPVCSFPDYMEGKTFSEFRTSCRNNTQFRVIDVSLTSLDETSDSVLINTGCYKNNNTAIDVPTTLRANSYLFNHRCSVQMMYEINIDEFTTKVRNYTPAEDSWLTFSFFLITDSYSIIQVGTSGPTNHGLLWYESTCPIEIYCLDMTPNFLRVYNVHLSARYIFCPILLSTGQIEEHKCIDYSLSTVEILLTNREFQIALYTSTVIVCLVLGALCVYALIRKNPHLLKGSKRLLFVKHRTVDALVLPPKVPLRNDLMNAPIPNCDDDHIFTVSSAQFLGNSFRRQKSTRSEHSYAPSYVSAIQPTEKQLAEWRIKHHFNKEPIPTVSSELSAYDWVSKDNSSRSIDLPYISLDSESGKTYNSVK